MFKIVLRDEGINTGLNPERSIGGLLNRTFLCEEIVLEDEIKNKRNIKSEHDKSNKNKSENDKLIIKSDDNNSEIDKRIIGSESKIKVTKRKKIDPKIKSMTNHDKKTLKMLNKYKG